MVSAANYLFKISKNINWTSEQDKILIDFVRNHKINYNIKCKNYRRIHLKQHFWCEIGVALNKTGMYYIL